MQENKSGCFFSEHCVLVVIITLCSLLGLCGGKKTTEKLGNITADVVIGAVHRSETQRCDIVKLRCVEERRLIHQLTQALQQHSRSNDFFCLNFKYVQKRFFLYFGSVFSQIQNKFDLILFEKMHFIMGIHSYLLLPCNINDCAVTTIFTISLLRLRSVNLLFNKRICVCVCVVE